MSKDSATAPLVEPEEMPDESKQSKAILRKVKSVTKESHDIEEGLKTWEDSLKSSLGSGRPEQVVVDHWKALQYLNKIQAKVIHNEEAEKRGDAVDETLKIMKKSTSILTHFPSRAATPIVAKRSSPREAKSGSSSPKPIKVTDTDKAEIASQKLSASPSSSPSASSSMAAASPSKKRPSILKLSDLTFGKDDPLDKIVEFDGKPVKHLSKNEEFENFGRNLKNRPAVTFEPQTRTGVCNVVKWAVANGKRVRAAGYRHTWSSIYGEDNEVLLSMIPAKIATGKSYTPVTKTKVQEDSLAFITFLREENGVAYVRIGASTTNDQFRVWALENHWTIPMSVDLVEITFGGSTSPMTHGTGIKNGTMADLITEVEFINANGELQIVNSEHKLRAAAGALGVMGIITAMTMKLQKLTHAKMRPYKTPAMLGIPPPLTSSGKPACRIPKQVDCGASEAQLLGAQKTFESQVANDYYNEYFWFPFQTQAFVNCWNDDGDPAESKPLGQCTALMQDVQATLGDSVNKILGLIPGSGKFMTQFVTMAAMSVLPDLSTKKPEITPVIEAFYFRRGLHNMTMWDMELTIPIPGRADKPEKPDWTVINKAWWDAINLIYDYASQDKYPVRLGLAMHVVSDSNMYMAPEHGNKNTTSKLHKTFGSLTINISTVPQTPEPLWFEFCQALADKWHSYTYPTDPQTRLNTRAHWVKQWEMMTYDGVPLPEHYRKVAYKDNITEFTTQLKAIATAGKFDYKLMRKTFGNPLLDSILWPNKS